MQNDQNSSSSSDREESMDELIEQPEAIEEANVTPEEGKPKIPQVDEAEFLPQDMEYQEEMPEEPETVAVEEEAGDIPDTLQESSQEIAAESRVRRLFRIGIRWTAAVLIIFGLGLLTGIFAFYRPATREAENAETQWRAELSSANDTIQELENEVAELETEIANLQPLKNKNEDLLAEQVGLNLHIAILDSRLDVANAQLALTEEDNAQARVILDQTARTFDKINDLLEPGKQEVVSDLRQRLELVLQELDDDPFAAQSDLDVLETKLLQLQDSLFGN